MSAQFQKWYGVVCRRLKAGASSLIRPVAHSSTSSGHQSEHQKMACCSAKVLTTGSPLPPLKEGQVRLYSMRFCPFAHRARLVLAHNGVEYETVNIHLTKKPEWFQEKNPNEEVPVFEKDGEIVYDSLIVAEYLDGAYGKPATRLIPEDPLRKAHDTMIINYNGSKFVPNYYKVLGTKGAEQDHITDLMTALKNLEKILAARETKFFGGDKPAFIDFMIWPWQERLPVLGKFQTVDVSMTKFPKLKEWQAAMKEVPAVKICAFSKEMHDKFTTSWKGGDANPYDVGLE